MEALQSDQQEAELSSDRCGVLDASETELEGLRWVWGEGAGAEAFRE